MSRPSLAAVLSEKPVAQTSEPPKPYDRTTDTDTSDDPWREKFKRNLFRFQEFAWDMMMLDKVRRQNRIVRENSLRASHGTIGKSDPSIDSSPKEDDMGLSIGDNTTHQHYYPASPSPTNGLPNWIKAAALLGGSAGLAGLGAAGYQYLKPPAAIGAPGKIGLQPGGVTIEIVKDPQAER